MKLQLLGKALILAAVVFASAMPLRVLAQTNSGWSVPARIPDYHDPLRAPMLVADLNHTVYAFNRETHADLTGTIVARHWALSRGWSAPVDIFLTGIGSQDLLGVVLDERGRFHLIYYFGSEHTGNIYYSWADAAQVERSGGWSDPVAIGPAAGPVLAGAISVDGQGRLVVIYAGQRQGVGVYAVHSGDGGTTWSEPALVSLAEKPDVGPVAMRLTADEQGRVHAIWHSANESGQGEEIRYARLEADLVEWGHELVLARRDTELENMGWGSLLDAGAQGDALIVAFQDGYPPTRWVRQSSDGGLTWSSPVRPFPHIGGYGYTALVKDSAGVVHMVLGDRVQQPEIHGMWYSTLLGQIWTPLEPITSGPVRADYDPCCPQAVVSQGNVLLATWAHNVVSENLTGAWYAYLVLGSPELPVQVPPTPAADLTATPTAAPPAVTESTVTLAAPSPSPPVNPPRDSASGASPPGSAATPVILGALPVVLLVAVLTLARRLRR